MAYDQIAVQARFNESYKTAQEVSDWRKLCQMITSNAPTVPISHLGSAGSFKRYNEVITTEKGSLGYDYTIYNYAWYNSIEVDDLPNRTYNDKVPQMWGDKIASLAPMAMQFQERYFWETFLANGTDFSASAFFSSRTIGSTTVNNIISGSGVATEDAIMQDLDSALKAMAQFKHDNNKEYINTPVYSGLVLIHPLEIASKIRLILTKSQINGTENVYKDYNIIPMAVPHLSDSGITGYSASDWYLAKIDNDSIKPMVFSQVTAPMVEQMKKMSTVERTKWLAYMDFGVGYGDPRKIIKVNN